MTAQAPYESLRAELLNLARECEGIEGLGSGVIAHRIRYFDSSVDRHFLKQPLAANKPAGEDRRVLTEALADLDVSAWECPQCGHSEDCATMDVAHMIRAHLDDTRQAQAQGSEAAHAQAGGMIE